ncbi:hypothetical protein [Coleofasciculus sp.]|uniref:hypothetical protein n=1 Tax=Coleofasciculus sp. TaxID=3100458 RepID=UPI003A3FA602
MLKKIGIICLAFLVGILIFPPLTSAQSTAALASRLSRLETENFQLRSQISRIESQLATLTRQVPSPNRPLNPPTPAPSVPPRTPPRVLSSDQRFDRLATLVIELKERIQDLEAQVAELQEQI